MHPYWSQIARELSPYVPGEQPRIANLVKLNTNESPLGPSPLALYAKTTTNVRDWSAAPADFATDGDNHDSLPVVMPDDAFAVFYIHADGSPYDVYSRRSTDGVAFETPLAHVVGDADDVEPHPLVGTSSQKVELYWGSAAAGSNDYDILRLVDVAVSDAIFGDGFDD